MTLEQVRERLLAECEGFKWSRGFGLRGWCKHHGLHVGHVSEFLNGRRGPPQDLLDLFSLEWQLVEKKANDVKNMVSSELG